MTNKELNKIKKANKEFMNEFFKTYKKISLEDKKEKGSK